MHTRSARPAGLAGCLVLAAGSAFPAPPQKAAPPKGPAAPITIAHKDVGCVLAGRFPRLEACFTPADAVARARVEFRSDERSVWYAVDMARDGACYSALLPKPTTAIERFQYFVEAIDRSFLTAYKPDQAPGGAYAPRVVAHAAECGQGGVVGATSQPTSSLLVSVARDASGKVVQAAAQAAGTPASISGFSMDGVTMPGAPSTSAPSTGAGAGAAGASAGVAGTGIGLTTLAIAGGAVAAGAVVAVAASGGGDGGSGPADAGLTGRWTGTSANGGGLTEIVSVEGATCTWVWDLTLDLVQSGASLSGTISVSGLRSLVCSFPFPVPQPTGSGGSAPLTGSVSGNAVTFQVADITFTGTRSGSRLEGTGSQPPVEGGSITFRWSASR